MKLLENIGCEKGITLNSQLVDLLSIIDNKNLTEEQQNDAIVNYINNLKVIQEKYEKANSNGVYAKYKFFIQNAISSMNGLSDENRERLEKIYLSNAKDLIVCNRDKMIQILQKEGFDESIHTKIMSDLKSKDYNAKEGILYLTPEKVRTLYSHMFENGNRYDRVTFDNAGKYSGYVAPDGETYSTEKIEKMQKFCENHGMKSKINALMFYDDFPKTYEKSLDIRVNNGEITEEDKRTLIQKSLFDYVRNIGQQYGNRIESVDIFNELIYDPNMKDSTIYEKNIYKDYPSSTKKSKSERMFERYCNESPNIKWFYKNGESSMDYFSIVYNNKIEKCWTFYPDYIIQDKDNNIWIIETKGGEVKGHSKNIDIQIRNKFEALQRYADTFGVKWGFVRDENEDLFINNTEYIDDMAADCWVYLDDFWK